MLGRHQVLETLRSLSDLPVWLAGGVAVDFHVGRWTRDHHDIDLVAFASDRPSLERELHARGFEMIRDRGWITNWSRGISLAFEERVDATTGNIVVRDGSDGVVPGIYPGVPGNLDRHRWRTLERVSFRVASAEDEWVYTMGFRAFRPAAPRRDATDRKRGVTTIVISHRFSTVRRADRIVVLEHGRVVEDGTHDELIDAAGRYAEMYWLQAARFADGPTDADA